MWEAAYHPKGKTKTAMREYAATLENTAALQLGYKNLADKQSRKK